MRSRRTLILSEPDDTGIAQALAGRLSDRGSSVEAITYSDAESVGVDTSDVQVVALLPRRSDEASEARSRLTRMIGRLRTAAVLSRSAEGLAFVQFGGGRFGSSGAPAAVEGCGASAFARSLHLERSGQRVCVIDLDADITPEDAAAFIEAELGGPAAFAAVGRDAARTRLVPRARLQPMSDSRPRPCAWTPDDVILMTGGAKGITAECALALGRSKGVRLVLVGSSPNPPEGDSGELASTLARFHAAGVRVCYESCDVTDGDAVDALVRRVRTQVGPITGVVHAAGVNRPRRADQVGIDEAMAEVGPKLLGAVHLARALADAPLRLFVAFSSIIGVTGMPGNAWYGFSNEVLDLLVRRFAADHPETATLSIAFSVWGETGMGARLGSVEHLGRMGIGAIPTAEGVRRFLHLFDADPGAGQVVVTARLGGLDTWPMETSTVPRGLRFVERIVHSMPGVELVARTRLTIERDLYVKDHVYKGSYLFPTVFGLEAMTQAAAVVTGQDRPEVGRIEDIRLERPIVVDPSRGVEIEIRAEALETATDGTQPVRVGIRTEQTGFAVDHFAATLILGQPAEGPTVGIPRGEPLGLNPKADLYSGLLFQGPLFQRMGRIHELDSDHTVFESDCQSEPELADQAFAPGQGGDLFLGDPFFRDVLLQAGQLTIPQELCLPVRIDRIERFQPAQAGPGRRFVFAPFKVRDGREYIAEIFATDDQGRVTERLIGYRLRILEECPENPTAEDLAHPEGRDERLVREAVAGALRAFDRRGPSLALADLPGLHALPKYERHDRERDLVERAVRGATSEPYEVIRHANGRPELTGPETVRGLSLSLSHDNRNALCVVGPGPQGCDVEAVRERTEDDWIALLGHDRQALLDALTGAGAGDSLAVAGTRIWSAVEAVRKVTQASKVDLAVEGRDGPAVLLQATDRADGPSVLTLPVRLTRGPERMIALVVARAPALSAAAVLAAGSRRSPLVVTPEGGIDPDSHCVWVAVDGPQGQPVQELRFVASFRDASSISRRVPAPRYLDWMGKMRELVTSHNVPRLVELIAGGEWGLVTNWADVRVFGEATANDVIRMRFWTDAPNGAEVQFHCDFGKVLSSGRVERVAFGSQKATWVRLIGHGLVAPEPLPEDFADFVRRMGPRPGYPAVDRPPMPEPLMGLDTGPVVHRAPVGPAAGRPLWTETFQTTLEEANLVGNVYFANYFSWQNQVRDLFLHAIAPEFHRGIGERGELLTRHTRVDYLREAMPFDRVQVDLRLRTLDRAGAVLGFEYFRPMPDGTRQKLSVGTQEVAWVRRSADGTPAVEPWPEPVRRALIEAPHPASVDPSVKLPARPVLARVAS
jgi:NAD(P)-dependent dehydrogenase (short-subunit alcohol dehydrogenase family)/acyl-CoA thioesterase FadM